MSQRPFIPLYITDYRADTAHLSTLEHGAYLLLIMHYWMHGGLPVDDTQLSRIVGLTPGQWKKVRPILRPFFLDEAWRHKRIEQELAAIEKISAAGRAGGIASGQARRQKKLELENVKPNENNSELSTNGQRSSNDVVNDDANDLPTKSKYSHSHSHSDSQKQERKEKSKKPPSAAHGGLEFSDEDAPEDQFWKLIPALSKIGISRARAVQLAKLNEDFEVTMQQLRQVISAQHPASYLGGIIKKLQAELAPPSTPTGDSDEPAWLREKRSWGERMSVTRLESGQWRVDGQIYDKDGNLCGW